jgi:hypothetical protein
MQVLSDGTLVKSDNTTGAIYRPRYQKSYQSDRRLFLPCVSIGTLLLHLAAFFFLIDPAAFGRGCNRRFLARLLLH